MGHVFERAANSYQVGFLNIWHERLSDVPAGVGLGTNLKTLLPSKLSLRISDNSELGNQPGKRTFFLRRASREKSVKEFGSAVTSFKGHIYERGGFRSRGQCWCSPVNSGTESTCAPILSSEALESDPITDVATTSASLSSSSRVSVPSNLGDRSSEPAIDVLKFLEEVGSELLKPVSANDLQAVENSAVESSLEQESIPGHGSKVPSGALSSLGIYSNAARESGDATQLENPKCLDQSSVVATGVLVSGLANVLNSHRYDQFHEVTGTPANVDGSEYSRDGPSKIVEESLDAGLDSTTSHATYDPLGHLVEDGGELGKGTLEQMRDILVFAGPALGIWLSGPMMSLIDTAVVGNSSSLELAALGPGTVLCDQLCYVYMFLSVATSNLIATSLAAKDEAEAAHHLSRLLFVALGCGCVMFLLTGFFTTPLLQAFVGSKNAALVPAAGLYVQIRGLAWPAVLVGMVAQSASLGMHDSWDPLKNLAVASIVNLLGDIFLCNFMKFGIAGAAWATMVSQYVAVYLMLRSLKKKGYNALALAIPSSSELVHMIELAAPVLLTMLSKIAFYTVITYLATSMGAITLAAHQVMIGIYSMCTVSGEPLAQTAQSFMPALITGENRNLRKAHMLLRSLLLIGAICGFSLGVMASSIPWVFPQIFTSDGAIISQMRAIALPFLCSIMITPPILALEGTLLAGRDLQFLGFSMVSCFFGGSVMLMIFHKLGFGLQGSWCTLACFQMARFIQAFFRLRSAKSVFKAHSLSQQSVPQLKKA